VYAPKRQVHPTRGIKGHDVLLEAWRTFARGRRDVRLMVIGGGYLPEGEAYREELIARYGVDADPTVSWLSTVDDVRSYYAAADVSVSPSLSENHGAALEAGGMGVPSIVTDAGGLPETVEPGSGWVVPRDDIPALLRALEVAHAEFVAGTLGTRGIRAREWVRTRFDQAVCADRVVDVIEEAAAARGVQPRPHSARPTGPAVAGGQPHAQRRPVTDSDDVDVTA
jgi:glycosyltransferase involved in cell wall biosynthesis